ncbi:MAG: hypothetical protein ACRDUV_07440 [Pseudonocardiaceae bacterium]
MTASPDSSAPRARRSVYRVKRAYFVRALGRSAVVAGLGLVLTSLCVAVSAPTLLVTAMVVLTTIALMVVALVAVSMLLPPTMLQLDAHGFRASRRYSSGRRQAPWYDVQGAASQQGPEGWALIIQHRDGQHTALPLSVLDAPVEQVEWDVRARLDDAHGYRGLS